MCTCALSTTWPNNPTCHVRYSGDLAFPSSPSRFCSASSQIPRHAAVANVAGAQQLLGNQQQHFKNASLFKTELPHLMALKGAVVLSASFSFFVFLKILLSAPTWLFFLQLSVFTSGFTKASSVVGLAFLGVKALLSFFFFFSFSVEFRCYHFWILVRAERYSAGPSQAQVHSCYLW